MDGQGAFKAVGVAAKPSSHVSQAEAQGSKGRNLAGPCHFLRTISPPARRRAPWGEETPLLVEP